MSDAEILGLGAVAGLTIFIGLPVARVRSVGPAAKSFLTATATGILLFLLWDVLSAAVDPVEGALTAGHDGTFLGRAALLAGGFGVGLLSLTYYAEWMKRRRRRAFLGPGAASTAEFEREHHFYGGMSPARWLAVFIATGIGLHNFAEGLAIGQSAARDELSLAIVLIIGFGLHNATEGFGIVAPMSGEAELPSWRFLGTMGLIGGGPTFLGTVVGEQWTSTPVAITFLALAGGSILYVVYELLHLCRLFGRRQLVAWGIFLGLVLGFGTDFVLVAAGV